MLGKTPSPDGLPTEFRKTNLEVIGPYYFEILHKALEMHCLPPSMSEAVVVITKTLSYVHSIGQYNYLT